MSSTRQRCGNVLQTLDAISVSRVACSADFNLDEVDLTLVAYRKRERRRANGRCYDTLPAASALRLTLWLQILFSQRTVSERTGERYESRHRSNVLSA